MKRILLGLWITICPLLVMATEVEGDPLLSQEEWSHYMDHVVRLLDYVEATASLRDTFEGRVESSLALFEKKQNVLDCIRAAKDYLSFLESEKNELAALHDKQNSLQSEKIKSLGEPSIEEVRSHLLLAMQTELFLDKMMASKKGWAYDKSRLVFKDNTLKEKYAVLQKQLAAIDQHKVGASMLTQIESKH